MRRSSVQQVQGNKDRSWIFLDWLLQNDGGCKSNDGATYSVASDSVTGEFNLNRNDVPFKGSNRLSPSEKKGRSNEIAKGIDASVRARDVARYLGV